jgi:allophanate hydrolase subunit 1
MLSQKEWKEILKVEEMRDIVAELREEWAEKKKTEITDALALIYNRTGKVDLSDFLKASGITQKKFNDALKKQNSKFPKDK